MILNWTESFISLNQLRHKYRNSVSSFETKLLFLVKWRPTAVGLVIKFDTVSGDNFE
jgi:hypothetical protein